MRPWPLALLIGCKAAALPDSQAPPPDDSPVRGDSPADSPEDSDAPATLSLLTLNLHCFKLDGTGFSTNEERFAAIAAAVAAEGVQALAVQEACESEAEGVAMERLVRALDAATGAAWSGAWTPTHTAWAGTADEAQEGVGLLFSGSEPADVRTLDYAVQGALARRMLSAVYTEPSGETLRLATIHLEFEDAGRRRSQARQSAIAALLDAEPGWRGLLAGDFNAPAADPALQDLLGAGFSRLSAGSDDGANIDHVFAPSAANFGVQESRLMFTGAAEPVVSDHPGVLLSLSFGPPDDALATRFVATDDVGLGHFLALRGDTAPLDWELGWPAVNTESSRWEAVFLGWDSGSIAYKWLLDDSGWETGEDHTLQAGQTGERSPSF